MNNSDIIQLGTWVQINNSTVVEILGNSGFDFAVIDLEHGNISLETLEHMIRAAEVSSIKPIVRVNENNASLITKVLDLGPDGIVIPNISTKEDAVRAVNHSKYPPLGNRGSCPCIREAGHMNKDWNTFMKESNHNKTVIALVEGKDGINNFEEIASVEGIDFLMIGPFDLSVSLGIPGDFENPLIESKYNDLIAIARKYDKDIVGVDFSTGLEEIRRGIDKWKERDISTIMTGIDKLILSQVAKQISNLKH
ncbi:HpcH/HpaI aldolase family protein [Halobacillus amylolyticus]|uniref:Aldolase/citrate lyase family protein n=1 Tax=Halobacillus amylolyticus TaxID=2932259 RepID=A0ABY4H909_9BACI|nr:aldolase/citrate lyase family protein [Halobacillus amylolyticus]UOR11361.1 aldolase/citrate lyase family protein [Halobacillus amylolyticus]